MSFSATRIVIGREYYERVRKKSFIITTLLMPIIMVTLMATPALIAAFGSHDAKHIYVIDRSGTVGDKLKSDSEISFTVTTLEPDSASRLDDADGVVIIPASIIQSNQPIEYLTAEAASLKLEDDISRRIGDVVEKQRMETYAMDVEQIINSVRADITINTKRTDKDNAQGSTALSYILGLVLTMMLYMCLMLYGQMVMTGIIEEKNNRVLEIVVSSVKPSRLMVGKIVGIGLVAVTQIAIWGVLIAAISAFVMPMIVPPAVAEEVGMLQAGTLDPSQATVDTDLLQALGMLGNTSYLIGLFGMLLAFLVLGFLFYAAIYAAIGSAVDNIQDASQLTSIAVIPIIIGIMFGMQAVSDPTSTLSVWMSMIPFTSPMVMMARIPFGIDGWQIALSLIILALSTVGVIWLSAKIYRVGIFMYGKKPTWKELIKWSRYK